MVTCNKKYFFDKNIYDFLLELDLNSVPVAEEDEGGEIEEEESCFFRRPLITFLARDFTAAETFVLFFCCLQSEQNHTSGMLVLLTLAQARWTQVWQLLHSIIGRPPYGFRQ